MCSYIRRWFDATGAWWHRSWAKRQLRGLVRWLQRQAENAYCAEYKVDPAFDHSRIDLGKARGLLCYQVVVTAKDAYLLTYWRDQQAYLAQAATFPVQTGLTGQAAVPIWDGIYRDGKGTTPGFWRGLLTWQNLLTAFSLFFLIAGYTTQFRDLSWMFDPAEVQVPAVATPKDVLVGNSIDFDIEFQNTARYSDCELVWEPSARLTSGDKDGLQIDPIATPKVGPLKPNDKGSVRVTGRAVRPGDYQIEVSGKARGGLWSFGSPIEGQRAIKVWKPIDVGKPTLAADPTLRKCESELIVLTGQAVVNGLEMDARLDDDPGVHFLGVRSSLNLKHYDAPVYQSRKPREVLASIHWWTTPMEAMRKSVLTIILTSEADKTPEDWQRTLGKVKVNWDFQTGD